ncbi:MAG: hypothetical protein JSS61_05215 [Verrucomicrobia bacterium]|nr:hypothetical protein [Verrucomicrobiota bacterium]
MNLLDLTQEMGFDPHKTSASRGGEYHCPCPSCGGNDRFMFWPQEDRYWCRQCKAGGDAIQFCRDFQKLPFRDACTKVQKGPASDESRSRMRQVDLPIRTPSRSWEDKALEFTESSMQRLLLDERAMKLILQRGLSLDTIRKNHLGWNPVKVFYRRSDWGIEEKEERKWMCLPAGIVIPIFEGSAIRKLKIRKSEWKEEDFHGKYYEVPGCSNIIPTFGVPLKDVVVIVEAEFDAMLVIQEAGDLCVCIALGGAQKRPHSSLHQWLMSRKLILFALDFDEAGKKEYSYWQRCYPNLEPWPVPEGKSPGDYFRAGGKIRNWVASGLQNGNFI